MASEDNEHSPDHPVLSPIADVLYRSGGFVVIIANAVIGAIIYSHPVVCAGDVNAAILEGSSWGLTAGIITTILPTLGAVLNVWWFGAPAAAIIASRIRG